MGTVPVVLLVLAALSFVVALMAMVQLVRLSPAGARMRNYGRVGWWRFADIRHDLGPAADVPIRTYQRAFVAFLACIVLAAIFGALIGAGASA